MATAASSVPLGLATWSQRGIFILYMSLWISYGLLNQYAKLSGITFNSTTAVFLQCILKLCIASIMHGIELNNSNASSPSFHIIFDTLKSIVSNVKKHYKTLLLYLIPASCYALYDTLSYINLAVLDASTYFLLLQLRLVVTAVIHQTMFRVKLNRNQWIALLITTVGCIVKTTTVGNTSTNSNTSTSKINLSQYGLILLQIGASTFAGVYNEVLLKSNKSVPLNIQNIMMYSNSLVILVVSGNPSEFLSKSELKGVTQSAVVLPMIIIMSSVGVVTSLFLKHLDSVRKAIASALELVLLPVISFILFAVPALNLSTFIAVTLVSYGVYLYSTPVAKVPVKKKKTWSSSRVI